MVNVLDESLKKIDGYLLSIERNTETSRYEIKVGIPKDWIYQENDRINFDILVESEIGTIIVLFGVTDDVVVDDLIEYVNIVISTNKRIVEMQEDFERKLEEAKEELVKEVSDFEDKIEEVKKQSFSSDDEQKETEKKKVKIVVESDENIELIDKIS